MSREWVPQFASLSPETFSKVEADLKTLSPSRKCNAGKLRFSLARSYPMKLPLFTKIRSDRSLLVYEYEQSILEAVPCMGRVVRTSVIYTQREDGGRYGNCQITQIRLLLQVRGPDLGTVQMPASKCKTCIAKHIKVAERKLKEIICIV
jgi:hypothetical protein